MKQLNSAHQHPHIVAANPTKTTAAKAAAETCLSDAPAETGLEADGELEVESRVLDVLELDPGPELGSEPELLVSEVDSAFVAVVVLKPVVVEWESVVVAETVESEVVEKSTL